MVRQNLLAGKVAWWWVILVVGLSSAGVLLGMTLGTLHPAHGFPHHRSTKVVDFERRMWPWIRWDGRRYREIAERGYDLPPYSMLENLVYFPAYPLLSRLVADALTINVEWALWWTSNVLFIIAAFGLTDYLAVHPWMSLRDQKRWILLYCLWPASVFFRAAYSESLFLLCCVVFLYCLRQEGRRPLWIAALFAAVASATRVVGVALPMVFFMELVLRRAWRKVGCSTMAALTGLSLTGFVSVAVYQQAIAGDPLAFLHQRGPWAMRERLPLWERLLSMIALEPLWRWDWYREGVFSGDWYQSECWFCNYTWLNPLIALTFPMLLLVADWKRLAPREEVLLGLLLWGIPYFGHGHENLLLSHARYNLFVFSAFGTLVYLLRPLPGWLFSVVVLLLGGLLLFFSYGFGAECRVF